MTIYNVIGSMPINGNTSVVIDDNGQFLKNGIGILDDQGKPHEILSVAMTTSYNEESLNKTTLLISGSFSSSKIYV